MSRGEKSEGLTWRRQDADNSNGRAVLRHGPISIRYASCTREGGGDPLTPQRNPARSTGPPDPQGKDGDATEVVPWVGAPAPSDAGHCITHPQKPSVSGPELPRHPFSFLPFPLFLLRVTVRVPFPCPKTQTGVEGSGSMDWIRPASLRRRKSEPASSRLIALYRASSNRLGSSNSSTPASAQQKSRENPL